MPRSGRDPGRLRVVSVGTEAVYSTSPLSLLTYYCNSVQTQAAVIKENKEKS